MIFEWSIAALLSIIALLAAYIFKLRRQLKTIKERSQSQELQEFVGDLMRGGALIRVSHISPENLILRAPRNG